MESFLTAYETDVGIRKNTNQDSLLLQGIAKEEKEALLAVLCDGMGGMDKGELASGMVIKEFSKWFLEIFTQQENFLQAAEVEKQWLEMLKVCNEKLMQYGEENRIQLGTTVTAILLYSTGGYLIGHIGDTRVYHVTDSMVQLTEDHTWIARELKRGTITQKEAQTDNRRNVLLQCIGVNNDFEPQLLTGELQQGEALLLCSDGFRHVISEEEIYREINPGKITEEAQAAMELKKLVELNKERQETDNITAIYIKRK